MSDHGGIGWDRSTVDPLGDLLAAMYAVTEQPYRATMTYGTPSQWRRAYEAGLVDRVPGDQAEDDAPPWVPDWSVPAIREDPWAGAWEARELGRCEHGRTVRWHAASGYQRHIDDGTTCDGWIEQG